MDSLLIYTEQSSPRLIYTLNLLVKNLLGLKYELTQNAEEFKEFNGPKFSYSTKPVYDELHFESVKFLFENDIKYQPINFIEWENHVGFFPVYEAGVIPFDLFATAFFMVSRYEEYLPNKKDKYDRYRASQSLNFKAGILEKPVVNNYAKALEYLLHKRYPHITFRRIPFRYQATFDIDIAYSYRGKSVKRTLGGLTRSLLFSKWDEARERLQTLFSKGYDPFDTYDYIFSVCNKYDLSPLFFFLVGDESRFDKNISHRNNDFRTLIKSIGSKCQTGVHLSYRSHIASGIMQREVKRLEAILKREVNQNRFHYLRFQLPDTYERLGKVGITNDYSMGYAPHVGFRAGLCTPFQFFNLKRNEETLLTLHPITFMDTTFTHYYLTDTDFAIDKILQLMRSVQECGGNFTGLWHNSSFTERGEWKGWRQIFETVAEQAALIQQSEKAPVY